jgi:photosystem II stability/assembly factor-like uncharacterized protein
MNHCLFQRFVVLGRRTLAACTMPLVAVTIATGVAWAGPDLNEEIIVAAPDDAPAEMFDENAERDGLQTEPRFNVYPRAVGARTVGGTWVSQGPGPSNNGQTENVTPNNEVVGAIHTVAAHPTNPDILYAGGTNGGLWKTTNATATSPTWTPLIDSLPSLSIGALTLDPANSDIVFAGLGRYSSFSQNGGALNGLLYSTNGGTSWSQFTDPTLIGENMSGVAARGAILVASSKSGGGGVFRSSDTGVSWTQISGGGGTGLPSGDYFDLVGDPSTSTRLYASAESDGIYRSDDTGATWTNISSGDATLNAAITSFSNNNTEMAVAPSGRLYVSVIHNGQLALVSYSDNPASATPTWTAMDLPLIPVGSPSAITNATNATPIVITSAGHGLSSGRDVSVDGVTGNTAANGIFEVTVLSSSSFELDGSSGNGAYGGGGEWTLFVGLNPREKPGGQGSIHASIVTDPVASNIVYIGGDRQDTPFPNFIGAVNYSGNLMRGDTTVTPTGVAPSPQWEHLTHRDDIAAIPGGGTASSSSPHADSREMVFDANGDIIQTDDGGIYRRTNPSDNTGDWLSINGDIQTTEFHDISYDSNANILIGGAQDTGTPEQIVTGGTNWNSVSTADGGDVAVDDISTPGQSVRYSSYQNLGVFRRRTYNAANTLLSQAYPSLTVTGGGAALSPKFVTPVEVNAVDGLRIAIGGSNSSYISLDQGDTLEEVGPGVGVNDDAISYGGRRLGVDNPDVLWVGSSSTVYIRTTSGSNLAAVPTAFPGGYIRDIVLDPDDWMTAYVTTSTTIYQTTDAGNTWTNITGDIASFGVTSVRPVTYVPANDAIVVGTDAGVFITFVSTIGTWDEAGSALPGAPVWDLDYDASDDLLVAGTLGRGAWTLADLGGPCAAIDCSHLDSECSLGMCNPVTLLCELQALNEGSACDAANVCTTNTCVTGVCTGIDNTGPCDDGLYCNGTDTCAAGTCSTHAGDPCAPTSECNTCNETDDSCFDTIGTSCTDDGSPCTVDACDGAGTCTHIDLGTQPGSCGDDTFGYRCDDSTAIGGPTFAFEDISLSGTSVTLSDDENSAAIPIGFSMTYYGTTYTNTFICANGYLSFVGDSCEYNAAAIPSAGAPEAMIAGFWEDLNPGLGGTIHYNTLGTPPLQRFVTQFTNIQHYPGGNPVTFQFKLFESSGRVEVHYLSASSDGGTHTLGIENSSGTDGIQYFHGDPGTLTNTAIAYDTSLQCDDGDACTIIDTCTASVCSGTALDCSAFEDDCNTSQCDAITGVCEALPVTDGTACDDSLFCNGADSCTSGTCASHTGDPCIGGAECANVCDEGVDSCNVAASTPCSADANGCTDDVCDGAGTCTHPNNAAGCDDGIFCNGADTCDSGACNLHAGDPCASGTECANTCDEGGTTCNVTAGTSCTDDGEVCTDDECDGAGACAHPANSDSCDDSLYCNGTDTCDSGTCSVHTGDPCIGGAECDDTCDESGDTCNNPSGTACTDDGEVCTDDECDGAGACGHPNNSDPCNDSLFCNGADTCSGGTCSAHAGDPCVGGAECADTCNETADDCNTTSGAPCSSDGDICTDDECDGAGVCGVDNSDPCDDLIACTTSDTCTAGVCVGDATLCIDPDHYKMYKAKRASGEPKFAGITVVLVDQFETKSTFVQKQKVFGASTDKNAEGINSPDVDLACYKIKDTPEQEKFPGRIVESTNQFGTQQLRVGKARDLCLPAASDLVAPPVLGAPSVDHYKCYKAKRDKGTPAFTKQVVSLDEFLDTKQTSVFKTAAFCTPVDKNGEGILDPFTHMHCYKIKDEKGQAKFSKTDVFTDHQLATQKITVTKGSLLCVPSTKTDLGEP